MRHIQERKRYLDQLITGEVKAERGPLKACTLVGRPKPELVEQYKKGTCDYIKWMKDHEIEFEWGPYESTSVVFYFPCVGNVFLQDECYVKVKNPSLEQVNRIIETTFDELLDVFEVDVAPQLINHLVGMVPKEQDKLSFDRILFLLRSYSQTEIATFVKRSSQTICDLKKGRAKPTLEVIQSLMKEFPLLPWQMLITLLELN